MCPLRWQVDSGPLDHEGSPFHCDFGLHFPDDSFHVPIGHLHFLFGKNVCSVLLSIKKNQVVCVFDVVI